MKKIFVLLIIGTFIFGSFNAVSLELDNKKSFTIENNNIENSPKDYTHTVLVEWGSAQFCGPCATWSAYIWNLYNQELYDFEYITMIVYGFGGWTDILNSKARSWNNLYGFTAYPTNIMDGDYRRQTSNTGTFPGNLDSCGNRDVDDLEASITVSHEGDAKLQIDIEIINNEGSTYNGRIRVPIAEIQSRYKNAQQQFYHNGFLDYAFTMNKQISIPAGETYTDSILWDGSQHQDNHGDDFGDIDPANIKVYLAVLGNDDGYVDELAVARVGENQPPNKPIMTGPTSGDPDIEYEYAIEITDPDEDDLSVWIDWGDETQGWLGPYPSGETLDIMHKWDEAGIFEVKVKTMDEKYEESSWSDPIIVSIGNLVPENPEISGPNRGGINTAIEFTFVSTDENNQDLYYYIDWGDGSVEEWIGPTASGEEIKVSHTWTEEKGFAVKAKVKDTEDGESGFTTHVINIPRTRFAENYNFAQLFQKFSLFFKIVQNILG